MLLVSPAQAGGDGYWNNGYRYRCDSRNNYCSENNYNDGWNNHNYHYNQPRLESIEYNDRIIRTGIRPNTDICSLVKDTLNQDHCDGYQGFNESRRTHIFSNYSYQPHSHYPNNQPRNRPYHRYRRYHTPTWNGGGCLYQDHRIKILCN